nr:deaminase domain-containing protein [Paenibacillus arenosi]
MEKTVSQGWRHGKGSNEISKELSDQMGASFKHIEILVQGESAYFHNEAIRLAYDAVGVKQYEYVAKLDRRTSDTCQSLDGKRFNVSDAQRRINYPPMHPRCRSTTIEVADGMDESRLGGEHLPKANTYEQWYKDRVDSGQTAKRFPTRLISPIVDKHIIDKVALAREGLSKRYKESGNFAYAEVNITGVDKTDFYAHSGIHDPAKKIPGTEEFSFKPENPIFEATEAPDNAGNIYLRDGDTEYKILNDLVIRLGNNPNVTGKIKLFTEKDTCGSCNRIIQQFDEKYPNITMEVVHNGDVLVQPKTSK